MINQVKLYTTDFHIHKPDELMALLYESYINDLDTVVDIHLEGPCCQTIGLYRLLDSFCKVSGYSKSRITIITANLIENHSEYKIIPNSQYWYEVKEIQKWLLKNQCIHDFLPTKHFGNFVGRSTWYRLWIGAYLFNRHRKKTLQTFHSSFSCNYVVLPTEGIFDNLELDHLNQFRCPDILGVIEFLNNCPLIISPDDVLRAQKINGYIPARNNQCYPLQHPANLMLEDYYREIFVDVVCETKVMGQSFFLSEKTWRPIVFKRPFVSMNAIDSLKNLKKLGFKTFDSWWDESYDDYSDQDRVRKLLKLIDEISQWPIEKCQTVLKEMQEVLDHNYQVFCKLNYKKINQLLKNE